jgi:hypothetical protein
MASAALPRWLAAIALCLAMLLGFLPAHALAQQHFGRPPVILSPSDGATVSSPLSVSFGFAAPAATQGDAAAPPPNGGTGWTPHAFLVIDSPLPDPGTAVQADAQHIPFPDGQTQITVTLAPGQHQLQIVLVNREGLVSRHFRAGGVVTVLVH